MQKCHFFQPRNDFRSYVNLGKSYNLINDSIIQNGGSLNLPYIEAFKLLKFSD